MEFSLIKLALLITRALDVSSKAILPGVCSHLLGRQLNNIMQYYFHVCIHCCNEIGRGSPQESTLPLHGPSSVLRNSKRNENIFWHEIEEEKL